VPGLVYRYTERPCITTLAAQTIFTRVSQQIQCITSGSINQSCDYLPAFVWLSAISTTSWQAYCYKKTRMSL